ncbi:DUF262 domain-containing protein [Brevundimonas sp. FT23028]|uniref:DUF262 domain-containing protein n=1 Tax=Brevundimonas sp. FT23028 TaxID=3393748 RepID=UPI003B58AF7C
MTDTFEMDLSIASDVDDEALDIISFKSVDEIERSIVETPFRAIYQTNNFLLPQIKDIVDEERTVNLRPEYQRRSRWTLKQKSLLIESFLLNIPVPPIFLFENEFARYEVMDGQQRLLAIKEFFSGNYKLSSLSVLAPLNGRTYSQLPLRTRRTLERASLSAIVLLKESRSALRESSTQRILELRKFVFERLNTGGKRLNAQEIRNAIFAGPFNEVVVALTRQSRFARIWGIPEYSASFDERDYESPERKANNLYRTMGDCEIALRFFALRRTSLIKGSMRSILDRCMETNLQMSNVEAGQLFSEYEERLALADDLFDQRPFRLSQGDRPPSVSMYDAVMVAIDRLWKDRARIIARKAQVQAAYWAALDTPEKVETFTGRANTSSDVRARIVAMEKIIAAAL